MLCRRPLLIIVAIALTLPDICAALDQRAARHLGRATRPLVLREEVLQARWQNAVGHVHDA